MSGLIAAHSQLTDGNEDEGFAKPVRKFVFRSVNS